MGNPLPAAQVVRIPQRVCGMSPSTRIPLPSHAAAAAYRPDTSPASHSARQSRAPPATGHDTGSLRRPARDLAPRPVALCTPDRIVWLARCLARRSAIAVEDAPPFARDRDVALGALAARRPHGRAIAARHVRHLPVPPQTPDAPSGDAPEGQVTAADCTTPSLLPH